MPTNPILLDAPETRLAAIIEGTRSTTGMSAHASVVAIQSGSFLRGEGKAPIDDEAVDGSAFDRRYSIEWTELDDERAANEYANEGIMAVGCLVKVGFLYGPGLTSLMKVQGTESTTMLARATARAISAGRQIRRACTYGELYQGTDIDPYIHLCERDGAITVARTLPGRLIASIPMRLEIVADLTKSYAP